MHPDITWCLITTLHGCRLLPFSLMDCPACSLTSTEQELIGFFGLTMGHLSSQWEALQASLWQSQGCCKSPKFWAIHLCQHLVHITHDIWLFRNQQTQAQRLEHINDIRASIHHEFQLGLQDLLPTDFFYISASPQPTAFLLLQVLALPTQDQELWLRALQQAHACGSCITQAELSQMHSSFHNWLHPSSPSVT